MSYAIIEIKTNNVVVTSQSDWIIEELYKSYNPIKYKISYIKS
jgi:hypothetical protein